MEGGTTAFVSVQCFEMLRTMADLVIKWRPNGSILIGHQLTVVSVGVCCFFFVALEVSWSVMLDAVEDGDNGDDDDDKNNDMVVMIMILMIIS